MHTILLVTSVQSPTLEPYCDVAFPEINASNLCWPLPAKNVSVVRLQNIDQITCVVLGPLLRNYMVAFVFTL